MNWVGEGGASSKTTTPLAGVIVCRLIVEARKQLSNRIEEDLQRLISIDNDLLL